MAKVWAESTHSGTHLLMMLAIADFADDEGNAYPSVPTLAEKCRMKPRNANVILAALRESGELQVRANEGPRGTNRYRIVLRSMGVQERAGVGVQGSAGVQEHAGLQRIARTPAKACSKPLQRIADEPSENHHEPEKSARSTRAPADRGSRLAADWALPDDWRAWALEHRPDLNPDHMAQRFHDHWIAQPGAKGRKADWSATWRNWVRNERLAGGHQNPQARPAGHTLNADDQFTLQGGAA